MPSIQHLTRQKLIQTSVTIDEEDTLTINFDRNRITPVWVDEADRMDQERDSLSLAKSLADVIVSWDVTTDDGSPFPPSAENLGRLSFGTLGSLIDAIFTAARPSRAEKNASSQPSSGKPSGQDSTDSSSTPAVQQSSPNGSELSEQPAASASQSPT